MNQNDARVFILALNTVAQFVPPIHMQTLIGNPICRMIEALANQTEGEQPVPVERQKPHAVQ